MPINTTTPNTLRADGNTMAEAAARLAAWGILDEDDQQRDRRLSSKKSGAAMTGTDTIKTVIDWPHFHIRQGTQTGMPNYDSLSSSEFVLGFLRMLRDPSSTFESGRMLEILEEVIEDSIDFG